MCQFTDEIKSIEARLNKALTPKEKEVLHDKLLDVVLDFYLSKAGELNSSLQKIERKLDVIWVS